MKKIFALFILLIFTTIFLYSCLPEVLSNLDEHLNSNINNIIEEYTDQKTSVQEIDDEQENFSDNDMEIIRTPYTLDQIKDIFEESKELFEKVRIICERQNYQINFDNLLWAEQYYDPTVYSENIYFRWVDRGHVTEIEGHEVIIELINKYRIRSIASWNYIDNTSKEHIMGVQFCILWSWGFEQRIVYDASFIINEEVQDEFSVGEMQLDKNWYYKRIMHPD